MIVTKITVSNRTENFLCSNIKITKRIRMSSQHCFDLRANYSCGGTPTTVRFDIDSGNFSFSDHLYSDQVYPCDQCNRIYRRYITLQRHKKLECGKEATFGCVICSSRFKHKHSLQRHLKVHFVGQSSNFDPECADEVWRFPPVGVQKMMDEHFCSPEK